MLKDIMQELESKGSEQTRKIYTNHGCTSQMYGVKVSDMKIILKRIKNNNDIALQLFDTLNADAQYLAGLAADSQKLSKENLLLWAKTATWQMVREYSVAWNIAESPFAEEMIDTLIAEKSEDLASVGWAAYCNYVAYEKKPELNIKKINLAIEKIEKTIHEQENRVKYGMNGFLIAVGSSDRRFTERCKEVARHIGQVDVYLGKTSCKVPNALDYIQKIESMGKIGSLKKTVKC